MNTRLPLSVALIALIALVAAASRSAAEPTAQPRDVRILITRFSWEEPLSVSASQVEYRSGGAWKALPASELTRAADSGSADIRKRAPYDADIPLDIRSADGSITVVQGKKSAQYRGVLRLDTGKHTLVNILPLEDYLRSVLPSEMGPTFPEEALKAQAVAARSYTLANLNRHEAVGADLCDIDHCQAYRGAGVETPGADAAVRATSGQTLMIGYRTLSAMYSSDCGGFLAPMGALGAASSQADADDSGAIYCAAGPRHHWEARFSASEVLKVGGVSSPATLLGVQISRRDISGRAAELRLSYDGGEALVGAVALRRALGTSRLRSLLVTVRLEPLTNEVVFDGTGWGHGAGLCQQGARAMALPPYRKSYQEILAHYYPGAQISAPETLAANPRQTGVRSAPQSAP